MNTSGFKSERTSRNRAAVTSLALGPPAPNRSGAGAPVEQVEGPVGGAAVRRLTRKTPCDGRGITDDHHRPDRFRQVVRSGEKRESIDCGNEKSKDDCRADLALLLVDLIPKNSQRQLMPAGERRRSGRFLRGRQARSFNIFTPLFREPLPDDACIIPEFSEYAVQIPSIPSCNRHLV